MKILSLIKDLVFASSKTIMEENKLLNNVTIFVFFAHK